MISPITMYYFWSVIKPTACHVDLNVIITSDTTCYVTDPLPSSTDRLSTSFMMLSARVRYSSLLVFSRASVKFTLVRRVTALRV